ncbi:MAG: hypothetical protein KAT65_07885 [Methanophagales archaeon]|jgi:hypothetical protein|nr:hypothetical protein [Methanophagales archaeon]
MANIALIVVRGLTNHLPTARIVVEGSNNETVKSVEEVKDQEQLRIIQKVIELQNELDITVKPHKI